MLSSRAPNSGTICPYQVEYGARGVFCCSGDKLTPYHMQRARVSIKYTRRVAFWFNRKGRWMRVWPTKWQTRNWLHLTRDAHYIFTMWANNDTKRATAPPLRCWLHAPRITFAWPPIYSNRTYRVICGGAAYSIHLCVKHWDNGFVKRAAINNNKKTPGRHVCDDTRVLPHTHFVSTIRLFERDKNILM